MVVGFTELSPSLETAFRDYLLGESLAFSESERELDL